MVFLGFNNEWSFYGNWMVCIGFGLDCFYDIDWFFIIDWFCWFCCDVWVGFVFDGILEGDCSVYYLRILGNNKFGYNYGGEN